MADDFENDAELDESDLGEPIAELRDLEEVPGRGFAARVMGALRRRDLGSHFATLGWSGLAAVIIEFLKLIFAPFSTDDDRGDTE